MINFEKVNVNPKGRKTGDCSTRALANVLNISWEEALEFQCEEALKCYYDPTSKQVIEKVLERFGYVKMKQPIKWGSEDDWGEIKKHKYTVGEMDEILTPEQMREGVLVTVANHHTCIKDGVVQDTWDCRRKSVGNYYVRG
jgi:hypothetical protein